MSDNKTPVPDDDNGSDDSPTRHKEILSGRTNEVFWILAQTLIDDPETPYENMSDFITPGLRYITNNPSEFSSE